MRCQIVFEDAEKLKGRNLGSTRTAQDRLEEHREVKTRRTTRSGRTQARC